MALITAQDHIYSAFRRCGQMRPGYTPQPELLQDALDEWKLMYDGLNAERTMNYSNPDVVYPVTGTGSASGGNGYTIGPSGADWTGPRPESIIRANMKYTSGGQVTYIHLTPISQEAWAALSVRQIPATQITTQFWYDPQFPNGVFNVFPPLLAGQSIELFTWGVLAPPVTLGATYAAPPGYAEVVVWGLAERLWPMCTKSMMANKVSLPYLTGKAHNARMKVRRVNRPVPKLATDFPASTRPSGYYDRNITYTGEA